MTSTTADITVVNSDANEIHEIHDIEKLPFKRDYEVKLSQSLLPQSIPSFDSEPDEVESQSDTENSIDLMVYPVDPNDTIEVPEEPRSSREDVQNKNEAEKDEQAFRGRPSSCVFVASLAASLNDDQLSSSVTKHFEKWGELAFVKVLRDPSNRPYAFVQYTNDINAQTALKEGQHSLLDGRTIRCEPAKVNRTLYIATGDGKSVALKDLKDIVDNYGEVEEMIGNNDSTYRKSNLNKAWFCKFAYRDDAIRAYANLRLDPDWLVGWAQNIENPSDALEKPVPDVDIDKFSVFVGQLDEKVTKEKITERFSRHGSITEVTLMLRPGNNFAFIKFATERAAASAVERENHSVFLDKIMHVQYRQLHHKKSRQTSFDSPKLNLAPPPVNLPYRRASTGSGFGLTRNADGSKQLALLTNVYQHSQKFKSGRRSSSSSSKYSSNRSASISNLVPNGPVRFQHAGYDFIAPDEESTYGHVLKTPSNTKNSGSYSPTHKQTPVSSPSNQTMGSSHDEAKSIYSSSTVSGLNHSSHDISTNPTTSGYGTTNFQHKGPSYIVPQTGAPTTLVRPPSSYYYYAVPKNECVQNQGPFLPYVPYPYFIGDSSLVEFPQTGINSAGHVPQTPYYMYYNIPSSYNTDRQNFEDSQYGTAQHEKEVVEEMDY